MFVLVRVGGLVMASFLFGAAVGDLPPQPPTPGMPPVKPDGAPPVPQPDAGILPDAGAPSDAEVLPDPEVDPDAGTLDAAVPLSVRGLRLRRL